MIIAYFSSKNDKHLASAASQMSVLKTNSPSLILDGWSDRNKAFEDVTLGFGKCEVLWIKQCINLIENIILQINGFESVIGL